MMLALSIIALAGAAEAAPQPERAEIVAACVQTTHLPEGQTADPESVEAYCACAMDELASVLTPAEFALLGRIGVARARNQPVPSEADAIGLDREGFDARNNKAVSRVRARCTPILYSQES